MFSNLRKHLGTAGLLVAVVALVAALGGGAVAAQSGGDATASAKKKHKKKKAKALTKAQVIALIKKLSKQGPAGPAGPAGQNGAPGANGADGGQGIQGLRGDRGDDGGAGADGNQILSAGAPPDDGSDGEDGDFYINTSNGDFYGPKTAGAWGAPVMNIVGADGASPEIDEELAGSNCAEGGVKISSGGSDEYACNGAAGEPWTAGGTLPDGKTLQGAFSATVSSAGTGYGAIPYLLPLESAIPSGNIHVLSLFATAVNGDPLPAECPFLFGGEAQLIFEPDPNHMCVLVDDLTSGTAPAANVSIKGPLDSNDETFAGQGRLGAIVKVTGTEGQFVTGTWAVTAPNN